MKDSFTYFILNILIPKLVTHFKRITSALYLLLLTQ